MTLTGRADLHGKEGAKRRRGINSTGLNYTNRFNVLRWMADTRSCLDLPVVSGTLLAAYPVRDVNVLDSSDQGNLGGKPEDAKLPVREARSPGQRDYQD